MIVLIAVAGAASALAYWWRREWIDGLLAAVAALALALLAQGYTLPGESGATVAVDRDTLPASLAGARALTLAGDGLRDAQWRDLPARPLDWSVPSSEVIRLDFPRELALGRMFTLSVHRSTRAPGRLQLLAENGQVLADARGAGDLGVQWLPPVAEPLVLQARLLDGSGKTLAQGPVPLTVRDPVPLQVQGRFSAPSFDLRVLDQLLADSNALIDWQVTLGKTVTRSEAARTVMAAPNLLLVDAAWFERAPQQARAALLDRAGQGTALLVLGANASDAGLWSRVLQLKLTAQPADRQVGAPLAMSGASLAPGAPGSGDWTMVDPVLWTRPWHKGRIGWLAAADWHRYAITEPQALASWWQGVLDRLGVQHTADVAWLPPAEMPLPGQRLEVCAQGVRGAVAFPDLGQALAWQRRPDRADASCVAVWPRKPGWLRMQTQGREPEQGRVYVFAPGDWPMWQAAERRDATARYAARTPVRATAARRPLPGWPFALAFVLSMLALWWRERR
ncbi:MAG: hypothetical protein ACJ8LG_24485 [Massilia sp.]